MEDTAFAAGRARRLGVPVALLAVLIGCGGAPDPAARRALERQVRARLMVIEHSLELFYFENARYPDSLTELTLPIGPEGEPLMDEVPMDPWGRSYVYERRADEERGYLLLCRGEDGEPGTEDDIPLPPRGE